jgi:hypothetical protein
MEIKTADYTVWLDAATNFMFLEGAFRLAGTESYAPIAQALDDWLAASAGPLVLDLKRLEYLNSSGINMLAKFTINTRNQGGRALTVRGNKDIAWQCKSLVNLKKLYPALELIID